MKERKTFRYCEFCDKPYQMESTTSYVYKESLPLGFINLSNATIVGFKDDELIYTSEKSISGIYCNIECLNKKIKEIMDEKQ